ncbi:hypothetical protein DCAR_0519448 [Daucus carota subsp. sativus]|uniref:Uncharacterized protein n=1 Tax=Daucus carota subsp. sativus TaxID=79200 RepID=A0A161YK51_DAUCS|nr:hypothetical protein DCAR_0519448 [Daucus carota subsp. sativus]
MMNDHEASTSGTKEEVEMTRMYYFETSDSSDEDCDRHSYVYEIDEDAEGELIDIPPNNVPLENIHVPPENIIPPPPPPPPYTYMKYNSQKVVLHPFTANIIGFKPNGSREPLNNFLMFSNSARGDTSGYSSTYGRR